MGALWAGGGSTRLWLFFSERSRCRHVYFYTLMLNLCITPFRSPKLMQMLRTIPVQLLHSSPIFRPQCGMGHVANLAGCMAAAPTAYSLCRRHFCCCAAGPLFAAIAQVCCFCSIRNTSCPPICPSPPFSPFGHRCITGLRLCIPDTSQSYSAPLHFYPPPPRPFPALLHTPAAALPCALHSITHLFPEPFLHHLHWSCTWQCT